MLAKLSYSVRKTPFYEALTYSRMLEIIVLYVLEKNPFAWFLAVEIVLPV